MKSGGIVYIHSDKSPKGMTWEEVSFQIDKGLKTVIRWRNEIINDMAICLFGIDAAIQAGTERKKKE